MNTLKNKVIIVTGASSGIGEALAFEAASRGAKIMLAARNEQKLQVLSTELKAKGAAVHYLKTDVSVEVDCKNLVAETIKTFGRIDVLINNAGVSMRALFNEADLSVIKKLMDTNFWGTVYCTKYALPHLIEQHGSVSAVSSVAGLKGLPGRTGYSASKFAILGFMEALRIENLHTGLHVLMAFPGFTASNIRNTALAADGSQQGESPRDEAKMMTARDVANYLLNAIEKRKRSLVLTRQGKLTVFLNKIAPSLVDKLVFNHMAKEPDSPFSSMK
ncbi:MAG: SDR family oxidoreductase [Bacteroidetes bacterium]|jgi:short-subunit dehydrogenase|nr:SDR family oxidoreductase [Bacteroidota bacterium]